MEKHPDRGGLSEEQDLTLTHRVSRRALDALLSLRSGWALPRESMKSWRGQKVKNAIKVTEGSNQSLGWE